MNTESKSNIYPTLDDSNKVLIVIFNSVLYIFDGVRWSYIIVNELNLPDTDFSLLKKPALTEIFLQNNFTKNLVVSGGFIPSKKQIVKTLFMLNFKKTNDNSYNCLLDFKYMDMSENRYLHSSMNINNKYILIIGGKNEKDWLKSCEYLEISSGKWNKFADMHSERANFDSLIYVDSYKNTKTLYVYGGYSGMNVFSPNLVEYCELSYFPTCEWKTLNLPSSLDLPRICTRIIQYDLNILIVGGSNGKHLLNSVYEIDVQEKHPTCSQIGELLISRSNFHYLLKEGDIILLGGSSNKFLKDDNGEIQNYIEKFTFNLSNKIESETFPVKNDILTLPLKILGLKDLEDELLNEPGFPYSSSIITDKLN